MRTAKAGWLGSVVCAVLLNASPSYAFTMSFSVYTTSAAGSNETRLYMYATVSDNSSGCVHGSYATTARIVSPTNRTATSQSSGLQASTSILFSGEVGNYSLVTTGSYTCSCIGGGTAGFGGSTTALVSVYHGRYLKGPDPNNDCHGVQRYNPYQCAAMCMQPYKCLPFTTDWAAVDGWVVAGYCSPGIPWPVSSMPPCSQ
jgi:hypothetical protein